MLSKKSRAPQKKSCQKKVVPKKKVVPEKTNIVKRKLDDKNWVALTGLLIRKHLYSQSDDQRRLEQKVLILRISNEYLIISIVAFLIHEVPLQHELLLAKNAQSYLRI